MPDLPVDIDATYADDPQRPGRKAHQEHHDALHALYNGLAGSDPVPTKVQDAIAAAAAAAVDVEASTRADADSTLQANIDAEATARAAADTAEAAARAAGDDLNIPLTEKGAAGGVAPLDGGGKIAASFLPSSVMEYQGVWNAATNTPALADGAGSPGDVYRVTVAGTRNLGSGAITFDVGDYAVLNASLVWEKSDTTDSVPSVDGLTGNVDLTGRYQPLDNDLTAIAALSTTTFGRALLALADAAALRTAAGLVIGTDVQGHDDDLDSLAAGGSTATTWLRALLDSIYQAAGSYAPAALTIDAQTGTTYTLVLADGSELVTLTNASAVTVTVPKNADVAYAIGAQINIAQTGAGQVTVVGDTGVTVNGTPGLKLRAQYSAATLIKTATNTWLLVGDLSS